MVRATARLPSLRCNVSTACCGAGSAREGSSGAEGRLMSSRAAPRSDSGLRLCSAASVERSPSITASAPTGCTFVMVRVPGRRALSPRDGLSDSVGCPKGQRDLRSVIRRAARGGPESSPLPRPVLVTRRRFLAMPRLFQRDPGFHRAAKPGSVCRRRPRFVRGVG